MFRFAVGEGYQLVQTLGAVGGARGEGEITYEQLQTVIESLAVENGYYQNT